MRHQYALRSVCHHCAHAYVPPHSTCTDVSESEGVRCAVQCALHDKRADVVSVGRAQQAVTVSDCHTQEDGKPNATGRGARSGQHGE
jgi:hypothetical protein